MKQLLLACVLVALGGFGVTRVRAAVDPGDRFLEVYFLVQDGDAAERASEWTKANAKYTAALEILREIQSKWPDWNPQIIEFRINYCNEHVAAIQPQHVVVVPAAPSSPAAPTPAPAAESDTARQLASELQQARENIQELQQSRDALAAKLESKLQEPAPADSTGAREALEQLRALQTVHAAVKAKLAEVAAKAMKADELAAQLQQSQEKVRTLEAERTDLNAKLQAALANMTATQTSAQIEDLMQKNADLTAKLAAAQSEIGDLRKVGPAAAAAQVQLRAELTQVRQQLEQVQTENVELKRSRDDVMAKLTESDRQLNAVKASNEKSDELIQQLRKENAQLNDITQRSRTVAKASPTPTESTGFLWWRRKRPRPASQELPVAESQSATGKLVATIKSPASPEGKPPAPPSEAAPTARPAKTDTTTGTIEVRTLLNEARAAFSQKDFETAATKYDAVLAQDPDNVTALSNMGVVRFQHRV